MSNTYALSHEHEGQRPILVTPRPLTSREYTRTDDSYKIANSLFGSDEWDLTGHLRSRNALSSRRIIKFRNEIPVSPIMPREGRDGLVLTLKELLRWERDDYENSWESIRAATRPQFKRLVARMVDWGVYRFSHLTPDQAEVFLLDGKPYGASYRAKSELILRRLYDLRQEGFLPDGLAFDPRELDVGFGDYWKDNKKVMHGETEPLPEHIFLPILAAAVSFLRTWHMPIIRALRDGEAGRTVDLRPFELIISPRNLKRYGLGAMLVHLQAAVYIVIASTVVGRVVNEFLDLERTCHEERDVGAQKANYVALPWSKRQDGRIVEDALAMKLTGEAIAILNDVIDAHPGARHSSFLFAALRQTAPRASAVGEPIGDSTLTNTLRRFLIDVVGMAKEDAKAIHSHQFRASILLQLCGVENGLVVAFREARHTDIAETCRYVTSDVAQLGLSERVSYLTGEAA